jgi:hypothetical protein
MFEPTTENGGEEFVPIFQAVDIRVKMHWRNDSQALFARQTGRTNNWVLANELGGKPG